MGTAVSNLHVTFVGRSNVGKSRLVDCIFNQRYSASTTINKHQKESKSESVRILPNGEPIIIETLIADDKLDLTNTAYSKSDFIILVLDAREELFNIETKLISYFQKNHIPFLIAVNKIEYGTNPHLISELDALEVIYFEVSCKENAGIESFRKSIIHMLPDEKQI